MSKLGKDFALGSIETNMLRKIRSVRGVKIVSLIWKGGLKEHMKWMASCNNPSHTFKTAGGYAITLITYGSTPWDALKNLCEKLKLKW